MEATGFGVTDYVVLGAVLSASALIGVYFGCFGTRQRTAKEYLYANRNMKAIPVGLSLYASVISTVVLVGVPTEVYVFGSQFMMSVLGSLLSLVITWNLILPVFCDSLQIKSPYEYFELRFGNSVRLLSSALYVAHMMLYMPLTVLSVTLTFSDSTGFPFGICIVVIGGICVFYTMLGGFSSVIWTDMLQALLMILSSVFILIMGINKVGGTATVWSVAEEGQRIQFFNLNPNPFIRMSFWSAVIGMSFTYAAHSGCSASSLQRYMTLKEQKDGKISTFIGALGGATAFFISGLLGICMYALYHGCDPVASKQIQNPNKIFAYFIQNVVGQMAGFRGLYFAGLLSAGLSTVSAELNTVSGLLYHDLVLKISKKQYSEERGAIILKLIVLGMGIYYLLMAPLLKNFKYIMQLSLIIGGVTHGSKLGIMLLGTCFPRANAKGVIAGAVSGLVITAWISIGGVYHSVAAEYVLPVSTDNCTHFKHTLAVLNTTILPQILPPGEEEEPLYIYRLSHMYYTLFGTIVTIAVGMAVSLMTDPTDINKLDPRFIIPCMRTGKIKETVPLNQNLPQS